MSLWFEEVSARISLRSGLDTGGGKETNTAQVPLLGLSQNGVRGTAARPPLSAADFLAASISVATAATDNGYATPAAPARPT